MRRIRPIYEIYEGHRLLSARNIFLLRCLFIRREIEEDSFFFCFFFLVFRYSSISLFACIRKNDKQKQTNGDEKKKLDQ